MKPQERLVFAVILIVIAAAYNLNGCLAGEAAPTAVTSSRLSDIQSPPIASLESLDSYKVHRAVWLVKDNVSEEVNITTAECVRKPLTIHVAQYDPKTGFQEQVAIGDTVWHKEVSGAWYQTQTEHSMNDLIAAAESFWGFTIEEFKSPLCSDCTTLVNEETANGIHCKHFSIDRDMPGLHVEVWIADQVNLPPVLIRGLRQEKEKNMDLYTEVNLTDINKPFTIQPPE